MLHLAVGPVYEARQGRERERERERDERRNGQRHQADGRGGRIQRKTGGCAQLAAKHAIRERALQRRAVSASKQHTLTPQQQPREDAK
jgi:hypothetical protein